MVTLTAGTKAHIWEILEQIPDPDIPVLSITDLGLVREVEVTDDDQVTITISPSYFGCPAMTYFQDEIRRRLRLRGMRQLEIKTSLSPAWTTDWLSAEAKEKLRTHGIAPPENEGDTGMRFSAQKQVTCPRCSKTETHLVSRFGSTPCKALWFCEACEQPFEYFKCH
ncbi:MAG TPA: 1,2-phenylacetyl-CoA epoxidase subunit PaaD [Saprospiraceae bacterium]|nr:1,2-phenylacetyl-CoA epoxidase subunit PaaD [Saprospiraceae bacterium]